MQLSGLRQGYLANEYALEWYWCLLCQKVDLVLIIKLSKLLKKRLT